MACQSLAARRDTCQHADFSPGWACGRVREANSCAEHHKRTRDNAEVQGTIMWELRDVEVTVIEIDSDGDGLGDEELVIIEDTDG